MPFNDFYRGKTVLVTGHTGFKGSWLSVWLRELGANVIGYSLDPINGNDNYTLCELNEKITDIRGDIKDFNKLTQVFKEYQPEIVFHMAAQPLVRLSYEIPRQTFEDNVMGTVNVLECVRLTSSVKVCVNITSDKCYDNKEWIWGYKETDPMGGYDPYSSSKGCSELVVSSYINSFFNSKTYNNHQKAIVSVRAGNVIGGGDWSKDRIIPDCIRYLEKNEPIKVRSPKSVRPWQHVLEPLSGYLFIGSKVTTNPEKYIGGWNFGPNAESIITVEDMVNSLLQNFTDGSWLDCSGSEQLHEAKLLSLDCSKANFLLNWRPTFNITQSINLTADWYKKYTTRDVYELCKEQIEFYTNTGVNVKNEWAF